MTRAGGTLREQLEVPPDDRGTPIGHEEGEFLFDFLRRHGISRTVEIGFAYGFSAAYILSATRSAHVAIDPHPDQYGDIGLKNLRSLDLDGLFQLERNHAHNVLPRLLAAGRRFQFAFVDGDHKFDATFVEFYYLDLLLDHGGYVMFHDAWMASIQHVASWIRTNRTDYRFVDTPLGNLILVQKIGTDDRPWRHFRDFSVGRALLPRIRSLFER